MTKKIFLFILIFFDYINLFSLNIERIVQSKEAIFTNGEGGFNILYGTDPLMDCLWNYAISKDIFIPFPEGRYHED